MTATILFISPDYASHYYPMSSVADQLRSRRHRVVFATGAGLRQQVVADGFEYSRLVLGPGNNSGIIRATDQSRAERSQLEAFFAASQRGMVPTLRHQAERRLNDLLFEPRRVSADIEQLITDLRPTQIVVDHLAFGATAALRGLRQSFVAYHPAHPSAIPMDRPYGFPPRVPSRIRVDEEDMERLRKLTERTGVRFTDRYNETIRAIDPHAGVVADAFSAVSPNGTLVNYPAMLGSSYGLPSSVRFIGSSVRRSELTPELVELLGEPHRRPRIYASLGSFFSARSDLLRKIAAAFRDRPVELVMAHGVTPRSELGSLPSHWTVAEHLPQPAVISRSDLVITHGGNNTVTEALTAGVPLLVGPLSTDQFAAAADLEAAGVGLAFDPNFDTAETIAQLAGDVLARSSSAAAALGQRMRSRPGQVMAADFLEAAIQVARVSSGFGAGQHRA